MTPSLAGLHHTSYITADAAANNSFYTQVLGLRRVWKTINFDQTSVYHLAYADAAMTGGTWLTFFEHPHAARNRPGHTAISETALRASAHGGLDFWRDRLAGFHIDTKEAHRAGRPALLFSDPEGLQLALVADSRPDDPRAAWSGSPVEPRQQLRGLDFATLTVGDLRTTARTLEDVLGFVFQRAVVREDGRDVSVFALGMGGSGREVHVVEAPDLRPEGLGAGGAHHLAFEVRDPETVSEYAEVVADAGLVSSGVIDRTFMHNLYFREPSGVLFEIAARVEDRPIYSSDAEVGNKLVLPDHLEPRREQIEARLRSLDHLDVA